MLAVALRPGTTVPVAGSQGQLHRGQTITNMAAYRRPWGEGESPAGHVIGQRALILLQLERRGSGGWAGLEMLLFLDQSLIGQQDLCPRDH